MALLPDKVHVHTKVMGRPCPEPMEVSRVIVAVGPWGRPGNISGRPTKMVSVNFILTQS